MNNDLYELCNSIIENCDENDEYIDNIKLMLREFSIEDKYIINELI